MPPSPGGHPPRVSVVVGVKNGAASLQRCLDSIAVQTLASREIVVVDSASTDGTVALLQENQRTGKVTRFLSEPDRGLYQAWNKALALARGEWLCFLGCDDAFHDAGALQALVDAAQRAAGGARVVYGRIDRITPSGVVADTFGTDWPQARRGFLAGIMIPHPGTLHHRTLFAERGRFDESFRIAGDYEMLLRELLEREPLFVDRVVVDMQFGGMSSRPAAIYGNLHEIVRARAAHGLHRVPPRLRLALAAGWLGARIQRWLGDAAYRWCADLYRLARGKPRIWTV
jgi:glycosyltransferase involved in cell wall biosynthesis